MKRFSIETVVRIVLILSCILLFAVIFNLANKPTDFGETPLVTVETGNPALESFATVSTEPEKVLLDLPTLYTELQYTSPITYEAALDQIRLLDYAISHLEIECKSELYEKQAVAEMQVEIGRLADIKNTLQVDLDKFTRWESEYKYATRTWYFLRECDYSEEVAAGILGNMMVETSGGSLALKPTIYNPTKKYYGLCQWSVQYYPDVIGESFEGQLMYLFDSITDIFKSHGFRYSKGFTYDDFLTLKTPEDAALAFAKVYERCGSSSYNLRKKAARVAYEYFTGEVD